VVGQGVSSLIVLPARASLEHELRATLGYVHLTLAVKLNVTDGQPGRTSRQGLEDK